MLQIQAAAHRFDLRLPSCVRARMASHRSCAAPKGSNRTENDTNLAIGESRFTCHLAEVAWDQSLVRGCRNAPAGVSALPFVEDHGFLRSMQKHSLQFIFLYFTLVPKLDMAKFRMLRNYVH